jgi:hypothetical protein
MVFSNRRTGVGGQPFQLLSRIAQELSNGLNVRRLDAIEGCGTGFLRGGWILIGRHAGQVLGYRDVYLLFFIQIW